jgi:hypothetical protein
MTMTPNNRMATPEARGQGRPPKSAPSGPHEAVVVDTTLRHVPPMTCKKCGRGMQPRVERWRIEAGQGEVADCQCALCPSRFVYRPATVRQK